MLFTVTLGWMNDMPVVTHIHGTPTYQTDADYLGRDATVDYDFNDITFPSSLPDVVLRSALVCAARRRRAAIRQALNQPRLEIRCVGLDERGIRLAELVQLWDVVDDDVRVVRVVHGELLMVRFGGIEAAQRRHDRHDLRR